jgi:hypothetical protein
MPGRFEGPGLDEDALVAGSDLVQRAGAKQLDVGYLDEDVPVHKARWYAKAQFRGAVQIVEDQPGPVEAVEALARLLLEGGRCVACGQTISLTSGRPGPVCRWTRMGARWEAGCGGRDPGPNRAQRRRVRRRRR